jgi:uncharacterized protein (DUF1684 family)
MQLVQRRGRLYLQVMWAYLEQQSFPLDAEAYGARIEERVNLVEVDPRKVRRFQPDVAVTRAPGAFQNPPLSAGPATLEPVVLPLLIEEETRETYIQILHRGDRRGVRVRDPEAPERTAFTDIRVFTYNPGYRVKARFEPYQPVRKLSVSDITGGVAEETCPGALVFQLHEQEVRIDVIEDTDANDFFLLFRDATSGKETDGGGRFLHVNRPDASGEVDVDFNKAYNPPCAFTPYATCPVPPRQNWLPVPIKAGEKTTKH